MGSDLKKGVLDRTAFVILAAGLGSRMNSQRAKAMHHIAGKPLLEHLVDMLENSFGANAQNIFVVVEAFKEQITSHFSERITSIRQGAPMGTAHAIKQTLTYLSDFENIVVLYGDVPFVRPETIRALLRKQIFGKTMTILTAHFEEPTGYGRIIRTDDDLIQGIVEEKDATSAQKEIREINTGIMCVSQELLKRHIPNIKNNNNQNEYYLTSLVELVASEKLLILNVLSRDGQEIHGVNNMLQLHELENYYLNRIRKELMQSGLRVLDPASFLIHGELTHDMDCQIEPNVYIKGKVVLGKGVMIGANSVLKDCKIGDNVVIHSFSHIDGAEIKEGAQVGPYARIRTGSLLEKESKVGNFVEIKNTKIGQQSKVSHLSYLGDSVLGDKVNVGAGAITCNYDGEKKHRTIIGDEVFVGSNSTLVAPLTIENEVFIAAGSTITESVLQKGGLVFGRAKQTNKPHWSARPKVK